MVHFVEITRKTAVKCFELTRALQKQKKPLGGAMTSAEGSI